MGLNEIEALIEKAKQSLEVAEKRVILTFDPTPEEFFRKTGMTSGLSTILSRVAGSLHSDGEARDRIISFCAENPDNYRRRMTWVSMIC